MKPLFLCCAAVAALSLTSGRVLANDEKVYDGSLCTTLSDDTLEMGTPERNHHGVRGSFAHTAMCPIVKTVYDNAMLEQLVVTVDLGTGASKTVSCTVNVYKSSIANASDTAALYTDTKNAVGTGNKVITFNSVGSGLTSPWGSTWKYYQMSCDLPAGTFIRHYYVREAGNHEETRKTYPSSMCRRVDDESDGEFHEYPNYVQTGIGTSDPSTMKLICPIVTDRKNNTTATSVAEIAVGRPIPGSGVQYTCTMYSTDNTSVIIDQHASAAVTTSAGEYPTLVLNLDINSSPSWSRMFIRCDMPGRGDSKILSYRVQENTTGGGETESTDGKAYPGTFCWGDPMHLAAHKYNGVFRNPSMFGVMTIACPITTEHYSSTGGLNVARVYVQESNASQYSTTNCALYNYKYGTDTVMFSAFAAAPEPTSGSYKNSTLNMPLSGSVLGGRYSLECTLAADSTLYEYEIEER